MDRRQSLVLLGAAALPALARAQTATNLNLVVPVPPGGSVDLTARLLGEHLPKALKQNVVIENKPGASGSIAAAGVARLAGDENTLMLVFDSHVTNPLVYQNLGYSLKDFTPISRLLSFPLVFAVPASLPVNSLQEFIALAKNKPGALNVSSAGLGTLNHLAAELFKTRTGTHIVHIPYRGGVPALQAVMNDEVQLFMGSWVAIGPHVKSGLGCHVGQALLGRARIADIARGRREGLRCLHVDRRLGTGAHRCAAAAGPARGRDAGVVSGGREGHAGAARPRMGRVEPGRVRGLHECRSQALERSRDRAEAQLRLGLHQRRRGFWSWRS
jgi:Tripartite tricarboxylate transporter family receptor